MEAHFQQFAAYNQWANARLHAFALALPQDLYERDLGVFFHSLHGTLNHLLLTDRVWLKRLTGEGTHPNRLDAILYSDRIDLTKARIVEDQRLSDFVQGLDEAALSSFQSYRTMAGQEHRQKLSDILTHLFNHQSHHRGQAHACCSILAGDEPPSLDLLAFQRGATAPDLRMLV